MKKSKLSLCLASSFIAAMSLAACGEVSENPTAVVTVKDSNGKVREILSSAIYDEYKKTSGGVSKFYNAILESLIRYEYENPNQEIVNWKNTAKALKTISEIKAEAENSVKNDKNTANEKAKTNGTSYDTEWENILSSHDCLPKDGDSESGEEKLLQYYIYQLEKEDITDKFFLFQKDNVTSEWLGVTKEGKSAEKTVKGAYPYHIRHILAKISGGSSNFYNGTITSDEAELLGNIMESLLSDKMSFAQVAINNADADKNDKTSAEKGGDLGIMTTTTAFVNEFKLGVYAYDAIYNHANDAGIDTIRAGLGLDTDYKFSLKNSSGVIEQTNPVDAFQNKINGGKLQEVPYDAFLKIKKYADDTKDAKGKQVNNGNEHYYPRNVLYNYYLNFHNPFVVTKELVGDNGLPTADDSTKYDARFVEATINGVQKKVLCDETGNIIVCVRSEHGIHFMLLEKSIFDYSVDPASDESTLTEYYTTLTPGDANFPKKADGTDKETYVGYFEKADDSTYNTRVNDIKTSAKSFDSTYDYRLFDYILQIEGDNIAIKDDTLKITIKEYIARTRTSNNNSAEKSLNEAWRSYAELIALQYDNRTEWTDVKTTTEDFRTIHPRCAIGFKNHTGDEWGAEGVCHYEE